MKDLKLAIPVAWLRRALLVLVGIQFPYLADLLQTPVLGA